MLKTLFTSLCIFSFSSAGLFTITDQQGNIVQGKEIHHTETTKKPQSIHCKPSMMNCTLQNILPV